MDRALGVPDDGTELLGLDGSYGEGGGQLVRTALALAAITGQAVRIDTIRARRDSPGLQPQHLTAVRALAEICAAEVDGARPGSQTLMFRPSRPPRSGNYRWEIGTAGSVTLLYQAVLLPLAVAEGRSEVILGGGTHVPWSPPVEYLQQVYLPVLTGLTAGPDPAGWASLAVQGWGWYPRGGGVVQCAIRGGVRLREFVSLERGSLTSVSVRSAASNLPEHVRQRQAGRADFLLRKQRVEARIELVSPPSVGQGTEVFILAEYQRARAAFTSYGRLRKPAEEVAEEACGAFLRYHQRGQPVDEHLADQLVLPMALAHGLWGCEGRQTQYAVETVTEHLRTQAWVVQRFLRKVNIDIRGEVGKPGVVTMLGPEALSA